MTPRRGRRRRRWHRPEAVARALSPPPLAVAQQQRDRANATDPQHGCSLTQALARPRARAPDCWGHGVQTGGSVCSTDISASASTARPCARKSSRGLRHFSPWRTSSSSTRHPGRGGDGQGRGLRRDLHRLRARDRHHGALRQLSLGAGPGHGAQRLLHLRRRQGHGIHVASRARRRLHLGRAVPGAQPEQGPGMGRGRDPALAEAGDLSGDRILPGAHRPPRGRRGGEHRRRRW